MVFVTEMDIDQASYRQVVQDLQELYGKKIAPFHLPIREKEQFIGYVNVVQETAKRWNEDGTVSHFDMPEYSKENLQICRDVLMETVAETSEEFMDRYFSGDTFSEDEIRQSLRVSVLDGSIVPVLMGSNVMARGMYTLMTDIVKYFPPRSSGSGAGCRQRSGHRVRPLPARSRSKSGRVRRSCSRRTRNEVHVLAWRQSHLELLDE